MVSSELLDSTSQSVHHFLPKEIHGWGLRGELADYDRETIYDYMNGAGEIYRAYNFRKLYVQEYHKKGNPTITAEIFEMQSPHAAFGVFTHTQGRGNDAGIGQDSEYKSGLLCFWKGSFFICIRTERETKHSKRAVLALGKLIARAIRDEGVKPQWLTSLPHDAFTEKSLRYVWTHEMLNYHYYIADKNILNLNEQTEAVLARYRDDKSYVLIVHYPTEEEASAAFKSFRSAYMPEAGISNLMQIENGKWTGGTSSNKYIVIIFDALDKDAVQTKIETISKGLVQ